jgi:hypothetical protein
MKLESLTRLLLLIKIITILTRSILFFILAPRFIGNLCRHSLSLRISTMQWNFYHDYRKDTPYHKVVSSW